MKGLPCNPYVYGRRWSRVWAERHKRYDVLEFAWPETRRGEHD